MMYPAKDRKHNNVSEPLHRACARRVASAGKAQAHVFVRAGTLEELKSKGRLLVHGPHRPILVVEEQDRVYALDNRCPHMGFPLLAIDRTQKRAERDGLP